ncbi:MAG: hypothetical protein AAF483_25330 [Planctomycetota bacterium]
MAKLARAELFSSDEIACVHVMNRAVRRAYLMGDDPVSGKNFDHRRKWMDDRLKHFARLFGIDLLAYAIMSNHFHLVLRSRPDVVKQWSDTEVARRWFLICPQRKSEDGSPLEPSEPELNSIRNDPDRLAEIRSRLSDISWWMRLLCQYVGQRANRETKESGKFWESRFKAVKLLDEAALLACSAYVDLNPIRAQMAKTLEKSEYTSALSRLQAMIGEAGKSSESRTEFPSQDSFLAPITNDELRDAIGANLAKHAGRASDKGYLNMSRAEYLCLLDETARRVVAGKAGATPKELPGLLKRVGLHEETWFCLIENFGQLFYNVAGEPHSIAAERTRLKKRRYRVRESVQQAFLC